MKIIMILLVGYFVFYYVSEWIEKQKELLSPAEEEELEFEESFIEYDFHEVQEQLIRIQQTAERIQSIEELITDMEITSPEQHELPLEMRWADTADGREHHYQFWADGRASTQLLLETACQEREQLRTSLSEQIADLYSTVVTQSVTQTAFEMQERGVDAE